MRFPPSAPTQHSLSSLVMCYNAGAAKPPARRIESGMREARQQAFSVLLRQYREAAGLTQEQLAERAGLTVNGVSQLERGERRRPYPHTVQALAAALGLGEAERTAFLTAARAEPRGQPQAPATPVPLPSGTVTFLFTD